MGDARDGGVDGVVVGDDGDDGEARMRGRAARARARSARGSDNSATDEGVIGES